MGWSDHMDQAGRCKKHPKHKQPAGVCSVCLTERLSKLAASSNKKAKNVHRVDHSYTSSSDVSSSYSTVSSPSSPAGTERMGGRVFFSGPLGSREMFRSKSMAVFVEGKGRPVEREVGGKSIRRRSGNWFWSKLMRVGSKSRRTDQVLVHSKSVNVPAPAALVAARN